MPGIVGPGCRRRGLRPAGNIGPIMRGVCDRNAVLEHSIKQNPFPVSPVLNGLRRIIVLPYVSQAGLGTRRGLVLARKSDKHYSSVTLLFLELSIVETPISVDLFLTGTAPGTPRSAMLNRRSWRREADSCLIPSRK